MVVPERVPALRRLLDDPDHYVAFQAAQLLTAWGDDEGIRYFAQLVGRWLESGPSTGPGYYAHRLFDYDNSGDYIAEALYHYCTSSGRDPAAVIPVYRNLLALYGPVAFESRLADALLYAPGDQLVTEIAAAVDRALALSKVELASRLARTLAKWQGSAALPVIDRIASLADSRAARADIARALRSAPVDAAAPRLTRFAADPDSYVAGTARESLRELLSPGQ